MRSFETTSSALALAVALSALCGCVAAGPEVADDGEDEIAAVTVEALNEGASSDCCNCNCNCGGQAQPPPAVPPPAVPPMPLPPEPAPQQPPVGVPVGTPIGTPVGPPIGGPSVPIAAPIPIAGPVAAPIPIAAPAIPVAGCAPVAGCVATPTCASACFNSLPGGFHTIVWPVTGQFLAIPGLRNCFGGGCCN